LCSPCVDAARPARLTQRLLQPHPLVERIVQILDEHAGGHRGALAHALEQNYGRDGRWTGARALLAKVREVARECAARAPIHKVHRDAEAATKLP
jgi:hypothetical protein